MRHCNEQTMALATVGLRSSAIPTANAVTGRLRLVNIYCTGARIQREIRTHTEFP